MQYYLLNMGCIMKGISLDAYINLLTIDLIDTFSRIVFKKDMPFQKSEIPGTCHAIHTIIHYSYRVKYRVRETDNIKSFIIHIVE